MKFKVVCKQCGSVLWIRGTEDPDTNGFELDDNDRGWEDACICIIEGGDFDIADSEPIDFEPEFYP